MVTAAELPPHCRLLQQGAAATHMFAVLSGSVSVHVTAALKRSLSDVLSISDEASDRSVCRQ